jgi:hypothetical protein
VIASSLARLPLVVILPGFACGSGDSSSASSSSSEPEETQIHRAGEMFEDYGWIDRLRKRDFRNGGCALMVIASSLARLPLVVILPGFACGSGDSSSASFS